MSGIEIVTGGIEAALQQRLHPVAKRIGASLDEPHDGPGALHQQTSQIPVAAL